MIWKCIFMRFQIIIFQKRHFQKIHFLQFSLKLHFLFMKSQSQTHPISNRKQHFWHVQCIYYF
jgi:hypothetical protein